MVELQETERRFDARRPTGESMADAYMDQLLARVDDCAGAVFVVEDEGSPIGLVAVLTRVPEEDPDEPAGSYALVPALIVPPPHRGKGVARALMEHAEAFARRAGAPTLRVEAVAGNESALALYRRLGFRPRVINMDKPLERAE